MECHDVGKCFSEPKKRSSSAVWVRGKKFLMDESGKAMVQVPSSPTRSAVNGSTMENIPLKRIDIGGVTYVQKTPTVLVRTEAHSARSFLR
jgi:hypothetical protein